MSSASSSEAGFQSMVKLLEDAVSRSLLGEPWLHMKSSFPKRYKSILIVFMKMNFFYLDPYILLIFNLSC